MTEELGHIPREIVLGRSYHLSWAKNRGMVWRLVATDPESGTAVMETPRTKKRLITKISDLRNINKFVGR